MINLIDFSSIFVANWKLHGNIEFIDEYFKNLINNSNNCVVICPPIIYANKIQNKNKNVFLGSQDVSIFNEGAYTGEVSASMLDDNNIKFCIVGHSERRQIYNEKNKTIKLKSINLIKKNIIPIVCVGEKLQDKEKNLTKEILKTQIEESIPEQSDYKNTIIAYEPIWAIGTGLTPSLEDIEDVHSFIKNINRKYENFKLLYGGSVKASNSADINNLVNVDGCLIGGSSLITEEFNSIIS